MSKLFTSDNLSKLFSFLQKGDNQKLLKQLVTPLKDVFKKPSTPAAPVLPAPPPSTPSTGKTGKRRKQKKLWDIPGISPVDKAEIMRILSEAEKVRQDTDEQIRMLIPDYKKPKKKVTPVRRTRPSVEIDPEERPPLPKRRPIPIPRQDVPDDNPYDRPLPPIPLEDRPLPPIPREERPLPPLPPEAYEDDDMPIEPTEPAPEIPTDVQDISVPVPPPLPPRPTPYKQASPTLLDEIRQGKRLRHVGDIPPPLPQRDASDIGRILQRRVKVAYSDDEDDNAADWDGYGRRRGRARKGRAIALGSGTFLCDPETTRKWKQTWGSYR